MRILLIGIMLSASLLIGNAHAFGLNDLMKKAGKIADQLPKKDKQPAPLPTPSPTRSAAPSSQPSQSYSAACQNEATDYDKFVCEQKLDREKRNQEDAKRKAEGDREQEGYRISREKTAAEKRNREKKRAKQQYSAACQNEATDYKKFECEQRLDKVRRKQEDAKRAERQKRERQKFDAQQRREAEERKRMDDEARKANEARLRKRIEAQKEAGRIEQEKADKITALVKFRGKQKAKKGEGYRHFRFGDDFNIANKIGERICNFYSIHVLTNIVSIYGIPVTGKVGWAANNCYEIAGTNAGATMVFQENGLSHIAFGLGPTDKKRFNLVHKKISRKYKLDKKISNEAINEYDGKIRNTVFQTYNQSLLILGITRVNNKNFLFLIYQSPEAARNFISSNSNNKKADEF